MFTVTDIHDTDSVIPNKDQKKEQLKKFYILPKPASLPFNNDVWMTRLIAQNAASDPITVSFRPYCEDVNHQSQRLILSKFFLMSEGRQTQIMQTISEGVPVQGSYAHQDTKLLAVVFQYESGQKQLFDAAVFYADGHQHNYNRESNKFQQYYTVMKHSQSPLQIHVLPPSTDEQKVKEKQIKVNREEVFTKRRIYERILLLQANQQATEFQLEFSHHVLIGNLTSQEQQQFVYESKKKFDVELKKFGSFGLFEDIKHIAELIKKTATTKDEPSPIVFMAYNQQHQDFVYATREIKNQTSHYFRLTVCKQTPVYQEGDQAIKLLQSFITALLPSDKYGQAVQNVNCFENMNLTNNSCRLSYISLSAMNQVFLVETAIGSQAELIAFHLQTGSCSRQQAPTCLQNIVAGGEQLDDGKFQKLNAACFASKMCRFLSETRIATADSNSFKLYKFLQFRRHLAQSQPFAIGVSYGVLWLVPNILDGTISTHLFKAMPFTPIECIFVQKLPLIKLKHFTRFKDFMNSDLEFINDEKEETRTIYDVSLRNAPVDEVSLKIQASKLRNHVDLTVSAAQALQSNEDDWAMKSIHGFEMEESQIITQNSQNTSSEQKEQELVLDREPILGDEEHLPLFTNTEVAAFYAMSYSFANIYNTQSYALNQTRFTPVYRETNNCFFYIFFHKAMQTYMNMYQKEQQKNGYDMQMFATVNTLFSVQYFDSIDVGLRQMTIHPIQIIDRLYDEIVRDPRAQQHLSKFFIFISDLIQQCSQLYMMQVNEFLGIVKTMLGKDLYNIINQLYDPDPSKNKLQNMQPIIDYFLLGLSDRCKNCVIELSADVFVSVVKLCSTILRILQSQKKNQIMALSVEFYLADYIYYQHLFSYLLKLKHQIIRMTIPAAFTDYSDKKIYHPLAKQYVFNQYTLQTLLKAYLESDRDFIKSINAKSAQEVVNITQAYEDMQYYRLFDKSLNDIMKVLLPDASKQLQQEATESTTGTKIISSVAKVLVQICGNVSNSLLQENRYFTFFNGSFDNQTRTVAEILELVHVRGQVNLALVNGTNGVKCPELPYWLRLRILREFHEEGIAEQCGFVYSDVADVQSVDQIFDSVHAMYYSKATDFYICQHAVFGHTELPFAMRLGEPVAKAGEQLGASMSFFASSQNKFVAQAGQDARQLLTKPLEGDFRYRALAEAQRLESALRICQQSQKSTETHMVYKLAGAEAIRTSFKRGMARGSFVASGYVAPLHYPLRQKVTHFFTDVPVVSFVNGHQTVDRNVMYLQLSTRSLRDFAKALDPVVLYQIEYKNKRDLKAANQIRARREFTIHELIRVLLDDTGAAGY